MTRCISWLISLLRGFTRAARSAKREFQIEKFFPKAGLELTALYKYLLIKSYNNFEGVII